MYKKLLLSCLLALTASTQAVSPAPNTLTRAIATILFYLPFLDCTGIVSAEVIDHEDAFQADIIWAIRDLSDQGPAVNIHDVTPSEDTLFFEGFLDTDNSFIKIWKFNRNPDACFRIRLKLRNAATIE